MLAEGSGADGLLVQMSGIVKDFPGVRALDNVDFDLRPAEVHCLLGENGAGKSTLIKILTGVYQPDSGETRIRGERLTHLTPRLVQSLGISAIYQEFDLAPTLTVAENIFLGREPVTPYGRVKRRDMNAAAVQLFERLQVPIDPEAIVADIGVGLRQLTEIVKALSRQAEIMIMDEPTSSLNEVEVGRLLATVRRLRDEGIAVIYISHRLEEIFGIGDRVTVLRDGKIVGSKPLADLSSEELIAMMVGRTLQDKYYKETVAIGGEALRVAGIASPDRVVREVSFSLRCGEIVGLAGIRGSGFKEVPRIAAGILPAGRGSIEVRGEKVALRSPADAIRAGIGYLPEDRKTEGLILSLAVGNNIALPILHRLARRGIANKRMEQETAQSYVRDLDIRAASIGQPTEFLSGGNQQKVVLAKWLASQSQILLLDEPTHGIDVGAKVEMYRLIARFVRDGGAVLLVSSEVAELMKIADRILVVRDGIIAGEFDPETSSEEEVLHMAASGNSSKVQ